MPTINADIDFEVWCSCGVGLCNVTAVNKGNQVTVDPCEKCLEKARDEEHEKGYDEGYEQGKQDYEGEEP